MLFVIVYNYTRLLRWVLTDVVQKTSKFTLTQKQWRVPVPRWMHVHPPPSVRGVC